jgi:UDP-glucose 4-epimerase
MTEATTTLTRADPDDLRAVFRQKPIDAVMQFAANISVEESMKEPRRYFRNNFANTLNLLDAMADANVNRLVFSSTAAVYGQPIYIPIDEEHACTPINSYGLSKRMVEQVLENYARAYGLRAVALRYFNAAGADPEGQLGPRHDPVTHLIPLVLRAAAGTTPNVKVFGSGYPTPDGTCVRDYVHVEDLCRAHLNALEHLERGGASGAFNLGNGRGSSVREVIAAVKRVTGRDFPVVEAPPRAGDPASLVADPSRAIQVLRWRPVYTNIETIIEHAWAWEQRSVHSGHAVTA